MIILTDAFLYNFYLGFRRIIVKMRLEMVLAPSNIDKKSVMSVDSTVSILIHKVISKNVKLPIKIRSWDWLNLHLCQRGHDTLDL